MSICRHELGGGFNPLNRPPPDNSNPVCMYACMSVVAVAYPSIVYYAEAAKQQYLLTSCSLFLYTSALQYRLFISCSLSKQLLRIQLTALTSDHPITNFRCRENYWLHHRLADTVLIVLTIRVQR